MYPRASRVKPAANVAALRARARLQSAPGAAHEREPDFTPEQRARMIRRGADLLRSQRGRVKSEVRVREQLCREHGVPVFRGGAMSQRFLSIVTAAAAAGMVHARELALGEGAA